MKQQGFHIAEPISRRTPEDAFPGSSQTASKLADGLQGLMDMCSAGSLMTAPLPAIVSSRSLICLLRSEMDLSSASAYFSCLDLEHIPLPS